MAIKDQIYHRYLLSEQVFALMRQHKEAAAASRNIHDDVAAAYHEGFEEGLYNSYVIMAELLEKEIRYQEERLRAAKDAAAARLDAEKQQAWQRRYFGSY